MARPKKATVDYFPHYCNHKTTIFVLEQKYGNDGYAFWFKILELLASTEGHYYDCRKPHKWEFLQAKTHLNEDKCNELLDLLAKLDAIDSKLWSQKVIWSDNFIDGISDVYKNRRVEIPLKPSFYRQKPHQIGVSTDRNPQSKVEESKVKESKEDEFLNYFNLKTNKKLSLTPERKRIIQQRLKNHSLDQLKKAVDNFIKDDWSDRHKYCDIVYCIGVRNKIDNLEKWLTSQEATPAPKKSPITVEVAKDMLARAAITDTMVEVLERLPEDELNLFLKIVVNKDSYTRGLYQRAKEILKKREGA